MKRNLIIASVVVAGMLINSQAFAASQINWNAQSATGVQDSSGNAISAEVSNACYVVTLAPGRTTANVQTDWNGGLGNVATLFSSDLVIYGTGYMGDNTGFDGVMGDSNNSNDNSLLGKQVYYVFLEGIAPGSATEFGMFTATSNANWVVPDATALYPGNTITEDLQDANSAIVGSFIAEATANDWGYSTAVDLANVVPEPSTYMLVGMGLVGLLGLRRRRS